jgi:Xaa-Pro dipeptidase
VTFEISAGEPVNVKHRLYIPGLDKDLAMWSVAPPSLEEARSSFDSDEIAYCEELPKALSGFVVHILPNTTEFPPFSEEIGSLLKGLDSTDKYLYEALHIARITKDEYEIDLIREANRISSSAHEVLMRELGRYASGRSKASGGAKKRNEKEDVGQWEVESERDAEALFVATCRRAG